MKHLVLLLSLLSAVSISLADYTGLPENVYTNLNAIQKHSKASTILLWCGESFTLNADGSQIYEWHSFRYFRDESARDAWGDPRINYSDSRQKAEILRARTFTADGRTIDCTPENAFNPVVPDGLDLAPDFSDFRQLVVTLLGLENGSISEFHYRVTTTEPLLPWLEGRVFFREENPVLARELSVQVPTGTKLTVHGDQGATEPSRNGDRYVWTMGEQQGYLAEDLAGQRELLPNVSFTTARDWEQICSSLRQRIETAISKDLTIPFSLSEALVGKTSVESRFDAIKLWVSQRFTKKHFDHPDFAMSLRPAIQVMSTGYGNSFELAVLVKGLAELRGISCTIVPRFVSDPVVSSLNGWIDPVLAVSSELNTSFVTDPLASRSDLANDLHSSTLYDLSSCAVYSPPVRPNHQSEFNIILSLSNLDKNTITGQGSLIANGNWHCAETIQEDGTDKFLNSLIGLPGFTCTSTRVKELGGSGSVSIDFEFTLASLDTADNYRILSLAAFDFRDKFDGAPLALPIREFPQEVLYIGEINLHLEAAIPDQWQITGKPDGSLATWKAGTGDVSCIVDDNRVVYHRRLNLHNEWLSPSDWSSFRNWIIESGPRPNNCICGILNVRIF